MHKVNENKTSLPEVERKLAAEADGLSGLSLDEAMASLVMQWKEVKRDGFTDYNAPVWQKHREPGRVWKGTPYHVGQFAPKETPYDHSFTKWSPSTDIAAAMEVENRIEAMDLQDDYIAALWDVIEAPRFSNFWTRENFRAFWCCIHATPEQRCRAALAAVSATYQHAAFGGTALPDQVASSSQHGTESNVPFKARSTPPDQTAAWLLDRALAELEKIDTVKVAAAGLSMEATAISGARVYLDRLIVPSSDEQDKQNDSVNADKNNSGKPEKDPSHSQIVISGDSSLSAGLGLFAVFYDGVTQPVAGFVLEQDAERYAVLYSGDALYEVRRVHVIETWCDHCSADLNDVKHVLCEKCYRRFASDEHTRAVAHLSDEEKALYPRHPNDPITQAASGLPSEHVPDHSPTSPPESVSPSLETLAQVAAEKIYNLHVGCQKRESSFDQGTITTIILEALRGVGGEDRKSGNEEQSV